jgi:hypothetical protein
VKRERPTKQTAGDLNAACFVDLSRFTAARERARRRALDLSSVESA